MDTTFLDKVLLEYVLALKNNEESLENLKDKLSIEDYKLVEMIISPKDDPLIWGP